MRVHVLGGFLGAGKTTAMRALARHLEARGETVALITNDQGGSLVDTALCRRDGGEVREIVGGCFCCRYGEIEDALLSAHAAGATVAIAEAVGSCTDLVATVLSPLADRMGGKLRVAPLSVVVDPWRVAEIESFPDDVRYLFRKQIEEADVVVLSRADLSPPDVEAAIRAIRPDVAIVKIAGPCGDGVGAWAATQPPSCARPLDIDYERYAAAEALLGWCNARVQITGEGLVPREILEGVFAQMSDTPVAHMKITGTHEAMGTGAITRRGAVANVYAPAGAHRELGYLVNARVAMPPEELATRVRAAFARAAPRARVEWTEFACFQPGRPVPVHRYASRCSEDAACCAAFYDRSDVRYLLGDSFHPGGVGLTLALANELSLAGGAKLLDVACGNGTSLRALAKAHQVVAIGLDVGAKESTDDQVTIRRGDAHAIPFEAAGFDAIVCECALSTFADQRAALREMHRVLRPGGRVAVSDMVVEGPIPEALLPWVDLGTCLARARTLAVYERLLEGAGFRVLKTWDARDALFEILGRIKRALVGFALARSSGQLPDGLVLDVKKGRDLVREAEAAVRSGAIGYGALIAERV